MTDANLLSRLIENRGMSAHRSHRAMAALRPSRRVVNTRWVTLVFAFLLLTLFERSAQAFPWMIRHDYKVCNTCHADPSGGGLLTLYGRGMEETLVRSYFGKHTGEEDPGKVGNFMFGAVNLPDWLLLQADGRALNVLQLQPRTKSPYTFWLMQADVAGQVTFGRFRANADIGLGAPGSALSASVTRGDYRFIARQFWLGLDLGADNQFLLRAGRINVPFGLRMIEHTAYVRTATRTDINGSQEYGVTLAYSGEKLRGEVMAIAGNFQVRPDDYRQRGYAAYLEYAVGDRVTVGGTSLITHADNDAQLATALWRQAHGLFARWAPVKSVAVMAESDLLLFSQPPANANAAARNNFGNASVLQVDLEPWQGLHIIPMGEVYYNQATHPGVSVSAWLGMAWFFAPHVDARVDFIVKDNIVKDGSSVSSTLLGQLHFVL